MRATGEGHDKALLDITMAQNREGDEARRRALLDTQQWQPTVMGTTPGHGQKEGEVEMDNMPVGFTIMSSSWCVCVGASCGVQRVFSRSCSCTGTSCSPTSGDRYRSIGDTHLP